MSRRRRSHSRVSLPGLAACLRAILVPVFGIGQAQAPDTPATKTR